MKIENLKQAVVIGNYIQDIHHSIAMWTRAVGIRHIQLDIDGVNDGDGCVSGCEIQFDKVRDDVIKNLRADELIWLAELEKL